MFLLFPALLGTLCLLAPLLPLRDPNEVDLAMKFAPMSWEHPMGTDYMGRDLLARVLWGGRVTLGWGLLVTAVAAAVGTCLGICSGFIGGAVDQMILRFSDVLRAFPGIVLVLIAVSLGGAGMENVCLAMLCTRWIWYYRVARNLTRQEMGRAAILASRLAGSSWIKILRRHILTLVWPQMLPVLTVDFGGALLAVSGYSFLGLGVLPPKAEWGMMMNDGRSYMSHPQMMAWPGLCLLAVIVCVNGAGDRLRDWIEDKRT